MFHKPVSGLAGIVWLLCCAAAPAQDFHVSTKIFDLHGPVPAGKARSRPIPVGFCESVFHAKKVYDYNDLNGQMTIFEPAHEQFVFIDGARRLSSAVSFQFIEDRLFQIRNQSQQWLAANGGNPANRQAAGFLGFQLNAKFQESYDQERKILHMQSQFLSYEVECASDATPAHVKAYLDYADWAARLKCVTQAQSILPGPRLAVNEALRRRQLLPIKVTLRTEQQDGLNVQAEHKFGWSLDADNMKVIHHWDKQLSASDMKRVPPEQFFEHPASGKKTADRR
jgi:hypothetical protein